MIRLSFLVLSVALTLIGAQSSIFAQEELNGQNNGFLEFGIGLAPPAPVAKIKTDYSKARATTLATMFPPSMYCGYTMKLSEKWDFTAQIGFKGLPNSILRFENEWNPYGNVTYTYIDSFLFRMNAATVEGTFKKFRYGSHGKGLYLFAGAGCTVVGTRVHPIFTSTYREHTVDNNALEIVTTEKREAWSQLVVNGSGRLGLGGQFKVMKSMYLDLGCQLNYHLVVGKKSIRDANYSSNPNTLDKDTYDYPTEFHEIVNYITRAATLRSYYFEIYAKIGLPL